MDERFDTEVETLKSEKKKLMVEKEKLNQTCNNLMSELETLKLTVRKF